MQLNEQQAGVLLMFAGLSQRAGAAPVTSQALKAWLDDEAVSGLIDKETLWLFRTGYLTTRDGNFYEVTSEGWSALDQHMISLGEQVRAEPERDGEEYLAEEVQPARDELPDVLILVGEGQVKAQAQRMMMSALRCFPADRR